MYKLSLEELTNRQEKNRGNKIPVVVLLENVRSLHNVGSVFRTCECAGIEKLLLTGGTGSPPRGEISKVALGAEEMVPWSYHRDPIEAARTIKTQGYHLIAVEQTAESRNLFTERIPFPCCLVFGHEVDGVSEELLNECEMAIEAPLFGFKHSLNISVCVGIVLFEIRRGYNPVAPG